VALAVRDRPTADSRLFGSSRDGYLGPEKAAWLAEEPKFPKAGRSIVRAAANGGSIIAERGVLSRQVGLVFTLESLPPAALPGGLKGGFGHFVRVEPREGFRIRDASEAIRRPRRCSKRVVVAGHRGAGRGAWRCCGRSSCVNHDRGSSSRRGNTKSEELVVVSKLSLPPSS
jgi:hypothetical protein